MTPDLLTLKVNKAAAAAFFGTSLPTLETWLKRGAPVAVAGSRGKGYQINLCELAKWLFADSAGKGDAAEARAKLDYWRAKLAEQEYAKRSGQLLDRARVEQAAATVLATIAQTLRSIPDNIERVAGLTPEQAEEAERIVDSLCLSLHDKLKELGGW